MKGTFGIGDIRAEGSIEFQRIESVRIYGIVNEHGHAAVSGIIKLEQGTQLMKKSFKNESLTIGAEGRERPLFSGLIESVRFFGEGDFYRVNVCCVSFTSLLDQEKRSRSFQNSSMRYRDLLEQVRKEFREKARVVITAKSAVLNIEKPIIQYEETDWEFLKRMAGRLHTFILPEITCPMAQLSIGGIEGERYEWPELGEYEEILDLDGFCSSEGNDSKGKFISYRIKSDEVYELGDKILWNGQEYMVLEKELCFETGIMEGTYLLGFGEGHCLEERPNGRIKGVSFPGRVIGRSEGLVKVHLDMDPEQRPEDAQWFPYSPVTGNVMYSVPELGAGVLLHIMDEEESHAVVSCCIRKGSRVLPFPEVNMMRTGAETYIAAPDYMGFCREGNQNAEVFVLDDELGLIVNTGRRLKLRAEGRIILHGRGAVSFTGVRETVISHPNAKEEQAWISMDCGRMRIGGSPIVYSGGIVNGAESQNNVSDAVNLRTAAEEVLSMIPVAAKKETYEGLNLSIYETIESGSLQSFGTEEGSVSKMEESWDTQGEKVKKAAIYIGGYLRLKGDVYEDGKTYICPNQKGYSKKQKVENELFVRTQEEILDKFFTGVSADDYKAAEPVKTENSGIRHYKPECYTYCIEDLAEITGYSDVLSSWEQSDNSRIVVCHALAKNASYRLVRRADNVTIKLYLKVNAYEKNSEEDPLVFTTKPYENEYRWKYSKKPDLRQYTFYDFLTKGIQLWEGFYENQSKNGLVYDNFGVDGHVTVKVEFCKAVDEPVEAIRVYMFDNRKEAVEKTVYIPAEDEKNTKFYIKKDYNWPLTISDFSINTFATVIVYTKTIGGLLSETKGSSRFHRTFTHEFGHVFGLMDSYDKRHQGPNTNKEWPGAPITDEVSKDNMMRIDKKVEPNDIEMMLKAWQEGESQYYFTYKDNKKSDAVLLNK